MRLLWLQGYTNIFETSVLVSASFSDHLGRCPHAHFVSIWAQGFQGHLVSTLFTFIIDKQYIQKLQQVP